MNNSLIHLQAQAKLDDLHQEALSKQKLPKDRNPLRQTLASILRHSANKLDPQLNISTT